MATALITGATSGLGFEFARLLASEGYDLIIVARDGRRLEQKAEHLRGEFGVPVELITADLSSDRQMWMVERRLTDTRKPIHLLVNNAGYGLPARFAANTLEEEQAMLDTLVTAPMRLTHVAATAMISRGGGSIINVSSVAGWIPQSSYAAAKSYLTAFTEAVHHESARDGIRIMALCPGYTKTEFHQRGGFEMTKLPKFMWLDAARVVADGWSDFKRGKVVSVPGALYKLARFLLRFR